jgi:hypothetical protein
MPGVRKSHRAERERAEHDCREVQDGWRGGKKENLGAVHSWGEGAHFLSSFEVQELMKWKEDKDFGDCCTLSLEENSIRPEIRELVVTVNFSCDLFK